MDRDKRFERTRTAYGLIVLGKGQKTNDIASMIKNQYEQDVSDEFINSYLS